MSRSSESVFDGSPALTLRCHAAITSTALPPPEHVWQVDPRLRLGSASQASRSKALVLWDFAGRQRLEVG